MWLDRCWQRRCSFIGILMNVTSQRLRNNIIFRIVLIGEARKTHQWVRVLVFWLALLLKHDLSLSALAQAYFWVPIRWPFDLFGQIGIGPRHIPLFLHLMNKFAKSIASAEFKLAMYRTVGARNLLIIGLYFRLRLAFNWLICHELIELLHYRYLILCD